MRKIDPERLEQTKNAFNKLLSLSFKDLKEISTEAWMDACVRFIVEVYKCNNLAYEDFCEMMDDVKNFYKDKWKTERR